MNYLSISIGVANNPIVLFQLSAYVLTLKSLPALFPYVKTDQPRQQDDSFLRLLNEGKYVDKSLLVEDVTRKGGLVCRILRPAGFGKTTNLKMLRRFFELPIDREGLIDRGNRDYNRLLFEGGVINRKLKIADRPEIMAIHGENPVIYVGLKEAVDDTYDGFENRLRSILADLYDRRDYLRSELTADDKNVFDRYRNRRSSIVELVDGLRFLSRLICRRYSREVYILIDDYDRPILNLATVFLRNHRRSSSSLYGRLSEWSEFDKTIDLIGRLIGRAVYRNEYLEQAIISGTFEIDLSGRSAEEGLRNDIRYGMLEDVFFDYYGFDQAEIDNRVLGLGEKDDYAETVIYRRQRLRDRYGYTVNDYVVYSPVLNLDSASDDVISSSFIYELLSTDAVQRYVQKFFYSNFDTVYANYKSNALNFTGGRTLVDELAKVLLYAGYASVLSVGYRDERLCVANYRVRLQLLDAISNWLKRKTNISSFDRIEMFDYYNVNVSTRNFVDTFAKVVIDTKTKIDTEIDTNLYVNAITLCLLRSSTRDYDFEIIRDSTPQQRTIESRTFLLTPIIDNGMFVILKYVYLNENNGTDLNVLAEKSLSQIDRTTLLSRKKSNLPPRESAPRVFLSICIVIRSNENVVYKYEKIII